MTTWLFLPIVLAAGSPQAPVRAQLPADVPLGGLLELTRQGEVALLPAHDRQPFNAVLLTRSDSACADVAYTMMDIPSWPKIWNLKKAVVLERSPRHVRYEIALDIAISPTVPGLIERPDERHVVFNDIDTGAQFIWTLDPLPPSTPVEPAGTGCVMRYSLLEAPGKASGWVGVVKALEPSAVDAANFAAALSSARGFASPPGQHPQQVSADADAAFALLATHGTALRTIRRPGRPSAVVVRRVVDRVPAAAAWGIRDKKRYAERVSMVRGVEDRGRTAAYSIGGFGGRVSFAVAVEERGSLDSSEGLTIIETVSGGDIKSGSWTWRLRPVAGGTDVELRWDADIVEGSAVMRTLARADASTRESLGLHMALAFVNKLVGGQPIRSAALAQAP